MWLSLLKERNKQSVRIFSWIQRSSVPNGLAVVVLLAPNIFDVADVAGAAENVAKEKESILVIHWRGKRLKILFVPLNGVELNGV